jgi:cytochrome oxidase Cu insertion factor (SCO1/SenC/PrrC family)
MRDTAGQPNRTKLLLVFAVFLAPVVAAYLFYYVWPPRGGVTNYGELIEPVTLPAELPLFTAAGEPFPLGRLRGKWLLLYPAPAACDEVCAQRLDGLRRVRLAQAGEQDRVRVIWLLTDASAVAPTAPGFPGLMILRDARGELVARLPVKGGLSGHFYIVDPLGNVMMRYDPDPDLKRMAKDLTRLLKASRIG